MKNSINKNLVILLLGILTLTQNTFAQSRNEMLNVNVSDVTSEFRNRMDSILPTANGSGCLPTDPWCGNLPDPIYSGGGFDLSTILTVGQKVWDFIVTNKPTADVPTMKGAVVPAGVENWSQLKGWSKPMAKVYRVQFKNIFGKDAGGFDYRIVFIHGGNYQGKGKYIGQISFAPMNVKLKTDRSIKVQATLLDALNFGSEEDPVAGVQLSITWNSQTTLRYNMNSIEYFLYGTGEVEDISNGTSNNGKMPLR